MNDDMIEYERQFYAEHPRQAGEAQESPWD